MRHGRLHIVVSDAGKVDSEHTSRQNAIARIQALGREAEARAEADRECRAKDPRVRARRETKRAYAWAGRPENKDVMTTARQMFPRKGQIQGDTKRGYNRMMKWLDGQLSVAASDPQLHAALNRTEAQRQTAKATEKKQSKSKGLTLEARRLEAAGMSRVDIARKLKITDRYVRTLLGPKKRNNRKGRNSV